MSDQEIFSILKGLNQYISQSTLKKILIKEKSLTASSFLLAKEINRQFIIKELSDNKEYFDKMFEESDSNVRLDDEQRTAIVNDEDYAMIVAGAGSGKTTTMAAKVKYLVDKKGIDPSQILVISYTNKAVNELQNKINKQFKIPALITTFHKFAYSYVKTNNYKIITNPSLIIDNYLKNIIINDKSTLKQLLTFYQQYFDLAPLYLNFIHNKRFSKIINYYQKNKTLRGDFLYDAKDVLIANILYLNNIDYSYQKKWSTSRFTFDINKQKYYIVILKNNNCLCKQSLMSSNVKNAITIILPTITWDNIEIFIKEMQNHRIINDPISINNYYQQVIIVNKEKYERFTNLCLDFVNNLEAINYSSLEKFKNSDMRTYYFLTFIKKMITYYHNYLEQNNYIDFEKMINKAREKINDNKKLYKYVIVDEYQDISISRFNFIRDIVKSCNAKLIVVGDDWQTIFSFAGSQINLFLNFKNKMGYADELKITNTYRNSQELINIAGQFVMQNQKQIKKQLHSQKHISHPLKIILYEKNYSYILEKIIDKLVKKYGEKQNILLLGRYHFDLNDLLTNKHFHKEKNNQIVCLKHRGLEITFLTVHMAKGLGFDNVIIVNGNNGIYGFPSLMPIDPLMKLINQDIKNHFEEERRLFYVALTRTKNEVFILSNSQNISPFIEEIKKYTGVKIEKAHKYSKYSRKD